LTRAFVASLGRAAQPLIGVAGAIALWELGCRLFETRLPGPWATWLASRDLILDPLAFRGEMDQGILRYAWRSLQLVLMGYAIALALAIPLGFALGLFPSFRRAVDPLIQLLRPISPLAWLPLGMVLMNRSAPAALFTIAFCAMWPTVLNISTGVQNVPEDYLNVARVLRLSPLRTFVKILVPATLPYMFAGFRVSLGVAWLAIVAVEMLTGAPGLGGFLWQEYNALVYEHMILCILAIGLIGLLLDRMMGLAEGLFLSGRGR
jgi:nitrate/nitrite transport system permease protein